MLNKKFFTVLLVAATTAMSVLLSACQAQPIKSQVTDNPPIVQETESSGSNAQSVETQALTQEPDAQQPGKAWSEYRDTRYGYGLALPCFWQINPTPTDGYSGVMTAHSWSDDFFKANSVRGNWKDDIWPAGAISLQVWGEEQIDPLLSTTEAITNYYSNSETDKIVSLEEASFGRNNATVVTLASALHPEEINKVLAFRLAPNKIMFFAFNPQSSLDSMDAQGILNSLVFSSEEAIAIPTFDSSNPPDGSSILCGQ
jgi:hypothetical protein